MQYNAFPGQGIKNMFKPADIFSIAGAILSKAVVDKPAGQRLLTQASRAGVHQQRQKLPLGRGKLPLIIAIDVNRAADHAPFVDGYG